MPESLHDDFFLSADGLRFLQWVARSHERGEAWADLNDAPACVTIEQLGWLLLIDLDGARVRLTDFGWDALANLIEEAS